MEFYLVTCCQKSQNITYYSNNVKSKNMYFLASVKAIGGGGEEEERAACTCLINLNAQPLPPPHS